MCNYSSGLFLAHPQINLRFCHPVGSTRVPAAHSHRACPPLSVEHVPKPRPNNALLINVTPGKTETSCFALQMGLASFLWVRIIGNKDKHREINKDPEPVHRVNLSQLFTDRSGSQVKRHKKNLAKNRIWCLVGGSLCQLKEAAVNYKT